MFFSGGVIMILAHAGSGDGGWAGWDLKAGVFFISTLGGANRPGLDRTPCRSDSGALFCVAGDRT